MGKFCFGFSYFGFVGGTGELKRVLTAETGLEAAAQKVIFRGRERENGEYLEGCGVKNRSKMELIEDPASIERRYIETKRNAKIQIAHRAISDVSMDVDKLVDQVIPTFLFSFKIILWGQIHPIKIRTLKSDYRSATPF